MTDDIRIQTERCQICDGASESLPDRHGEWGTRRCTDCGFVWIDPLPTRAELESFYEDSYEGATVGYFTKVDKKLRRLGRRMRHLDRVLRRLGQRPTDRSPLFLDIGASGGFMAESARQLGYSAYGIEPDPVVHAYAQKNYPENTFINGFLEEVDFEPAQFDALYCSEVIEHAPDTNRFTAALAARLRPGGVAYITTPDIGHWRRPRALADWDAYTPPAHCLYFTKRSLGLLLERHGLRPVRWRLALKPGLMVFAQKQG